MSAQSTWKKSQASMVDACVLRSSAGWCGRGAPALAEAEQFALDALVAPAGIVSPHLLDQGGDGRVDWWAPTRGLP
ncbi:hypothetical protein U2F26_31650 [Micromonospora sp. 4G57]|uniref:hypothetical protein n=1 Tax=Micromonospora TaxID=1873 RepID=UPI002ACA4B4C|nr:MULTISPECIES: hypothetical protein [unclassified Micromonospora]MDZ5447216.1 hypothetical protein [Micromonospora sp. 4G57]